MTETMSPAPAAQEKPLNTTQMRALEKLVKNDYETLENELAIARDQERSEAERRIRANWAAKYDTDAVRIKSGAEAAYSRLNTTLARLRSEVSTAGMIAEGLYTRDCPNVTVRSQAMDAAIKEAKDAVQARYVQALQNVRRNRLEAERRILQASIGSASQAILDALPTGREALALGGIKEEQS